MFVVLPGIHTHTRAHTRALPLSLVKISNLAHARNRRGITFVCFFFFWGEGGGQASFGVTNAKAAIGVLSYFAIDQACLG